MSRSSLRLLGLVVLTSALGLSGCAVPGGIYAAPTDPAFCANLPVEVFEDALGKPWRLADKPAKPGPRGVDCPTVTLRDAGSGDLAYVQVTLTVFPAEADARRNYAMAEKMYEDAPPSSLDGSVTGAAMKARDRDVRIVLQDGNAFLSVHAGTADKSLPEDFDETLGDFALEILDQVEETSPVTTALLIGGGVLGVAALGAVTFLLVRRARRAAAEPGLQE